MKMTGKQIIERIAIMLDNTDDDFIAFIANQSLPDKVTALGDDEFEVEKGANEVGRDPREDEEGSEPDKDTFECLECHGIFPYNSGKPRYYGSVCEDCDKKHPLKEADPDNDEFQCEKCENILDIEDSIKRNGKLICPDCAARYY